MDKRRNSKGGQRSRRGILLDDDDDARGDSQNFWGPCRTLHDYFIDLSGKRASVREEALSTILKALTLNIEQKFVELNFVTLVYQCLHFIKKGSPTEMKQAAHIIGLLSMITTTVEKVHEAYEDVLTALSQGGLKPKLKTLEILGCLTVVTFFGASNSDETESVMKLLWDLINPGTDSSIERKDSPAVLTAMISAWSFLLSTIDGWRLSHKNWQGAITYFSNIIDSDDEELCAAACEALALVFESNCLEKFSSATKDSNKELKDNIIKQLRSRLSETGNERISSQDPRTGFNSASAALDFLEDRKCANTHVTIGGQKLILSTWSQKVQLKFLKHFLRNDGFVKHMMENENFHNVFDFHPKRRNDWGNVLYVPEREEVTILLFRPMVARHNDCSLLPSLTRDKQLAKKKTMSPNSHLSKARTQLLKKQRDLSLKEREFDCFDY
ncbi:hypothetical protein ERO13_A13G046500v2 [Gossypium hirsutum]|uniref:Interferon-related developmental regulator N-terminal domain-containing protein n=2 Tax=Gossypium TaxID=3633 RepID=A0A1U8KML4_GOSHI|nr:uncharacterized protein LOC107918598 [Gossypium hirsutum]XP_016703680.2 uncharacterized protein LOC107918598 [Gossypium hirsutum]XP_017619369.2 uncharacterized protein LOC108463892 [Gossypium arboreum]XP_052879793.1 uncharacterized protein LOC108463892 [Gossypium arboreum]XP_052879794.1 uncharacterized protein LOC108463892 [Gossypium arboreum]KAB2047482.1 hypothetical protein ES319_A13G048600v1 [Gossypium barbadense]KAG4164906.1 hypothetical protein ERO13_A13G046500v2 [Gossypium hirsutum]